MAKRYTSADLGLTNVGLSMEFDQGGTLWGVPVFQIADAMARQYGLTFEQALREIGDFAQVSGSPWALEQALKEFLPGDYLQRSGDIGLPPNSAIPNAPVPGPYSNEYWDRARSNPASQEHILERILFGQQEVDPYYENIRGGALSKQRSLKMAFDESPEAQMATISTDQLLGAGWQNNWEQNRDLLLALGIPQYQVDNLILNGSADLSPNEMQLITGGQTTTDTASQMLNEGPAGMPDVPNYEEVMAKLVPDAGINTSGVQPTGINLLEELLGLPPPPEASLSGPSADFLNRYANYNPLYSAGDAGGPSAEFLNRYAGYTPIYPAENTSTSSTTTVDEGLIAYPTFNRPSQTQTIVDQSTGDALFPTGTYGQVPSMAWSNLEAKGLLPQSAGVQGLIQHRLRGNPIPPGVDPALLRAASEWWSNVFYPEYQRVNANTSSETVQTTGANVFTGGRANENALNYQDMSPLERLYAQLFPTGQQEGTGLPSDLFATESSTGILPEGIVDTGDTPGPSAEFLNRYANYSPLYAGLVDTGGTGPSADFLNRYANYSPLYPGGVIDTGGTPNPSEDFLNRYAGYDPLYTGGVDTGIIPTDVPAGSPSLEDFSNLFKNLGVNLTQGPLLALSEQIAKLSGGENAFSPTFNPNFAGLVSEGAFTPSFNPTYNPTVSPDFSGLISEGAFQPSFDPTYNPTFNPNLEGLVSEGAFAPTFSPTYNPTVNPNFAGLVSEGAIAPNFQDMFKGMFGEGLVSPNFEGLISEGAFAPTFNPNLQGLISEGAFNPVFNPDLQGLISEGAFAPTFNPNLQGLIGEGAIAPTINPNFQGLISEGAFAPSFNPSVNPDFSGLISEGAFNPSFSPTVSPSFEGMFGEGMISPNFQGLISPNAISPNFQGLVSEGAFSPTFNPTINPNFQGLISEGAVSPSFENMLSGMFSPGAISPNFQGLISPNAMNFSPSIDQSGMFDPGAFQFQIGPAEIPGEPTYLDRLNEVQNAISGYNLDVDPSFYGRLLEQALGVPFTTPAPSQLDTTMQQAMQDLLGQATQPQAEEILPFVAPDNPYWDDITSGQQTMLDVAAGKTELPYLQDLFGAFDVERGQEQSDLAASLLRRGVDESTIRDEAMGRQSARHRGEKAALAMQALNSVLPTTQDLYSTLYGQGLQTRGTALDEYFKFQQAQAQADQAQQSNINQTLSLLLNALGVNAPAQAMPNLGGFPQPQPSGWQSAGNLLGNLGTAYLSGGGNVDWSGLWDIISGGR